MLFWIWGSCRSVATGLGGKKLGWPTQVVYPNFFMTANYRPAASVGDMSTKL